MFAMLARESWPYWDILFAAEQLAESLTLLRRIPLKINDRELAALSHLYADARIGRVR